jgi:cell pole-organizing protein PopZ
MRLWIISGALALAVGLVAAPLLAVRSSPRTGGVDGGSGAYDGAVPRPAISNDASRRPAMQVRDVKPRDGGPEVVYVGDKRGIGPASPPLDAGPAPAANAVATADLQAQITALQARQAALQQQQATSQAQTQQLQQMNDQLQQMNDQLKHLNAQQAAAQQARADRDAATAAQEHQKQTAIQGLGPALDMLNSGNGQISNLLDAADQSFPPQARREIGAARDAIANSNLNLARGFIQQAINDAQAGR